MDQAENELSRAMELGDTKAAVEAQRKITALAIQADRAEQAKSEQARYAQQAQQYAEYQKEHVQQPAQPKRPDPKAEKWALKNSWFGDDQAMTYAVFGIHKKLIEQEGFDPQSDEYYTELDRRMADEFPHKLKSQSKRPAQTVASASRTATTGRSGKKVRLTPSQVAIAKKLGVPLEEYAKYVKE
jgi:phage I-like protein